MRDVLTVFIASPSDLAEERKAAFNVVAEVNGTVKRLGWSIDLLGWEDTLPGYGRPQGQINRDVEECDLFIGLLWRRWGTSPALDSTFSSGFEEEFHIARSRREKAPSPEIWMFFKAVEPAQMADAGEQLTKVMAFRDSLITSKTVLFKNFNSVVDWERMLRRCLFEYVFSVADIRKRPPQGPTESLTPAARTSFVEADVEGTPAAGGQIADLAKSLAPAFKTGSLGSITTGLGEPSDINFWAVRGVLLSVALVTASGSSATPMPTHELNTLYRYRDRLFATEDELRLLFKTMLAAEYDAKPGWYWFKDDQPKSVIARLIVTILFESATAARATAFEILRQGKVSLFDHVRDEVLEEALREIPSDLRDAAWEYLVDLATPEEIQTLRGLASETWLAARLNWLQSWASTSRDLDEFLPRLPDPQLMPVAMRQRIVSTISVLTVPSLKALGSMPVPELREAAKAELRRRRIPVGEDDRSSEESQLGLSLSSLMSGVSVPADETAETDEQKRSRLGREDSSTLSDRLTWYDVDGTTRYRLLVERGVIAKEIVRKDVRDQFQRIRNDSDKQLKESMGPAAVAAYHDAFSKYDGLLTRVFTTEALAALSADPVLEDVALARQCLSDPETRMAAIRIVASVGGPEDLANLIEIAKSSYGSERALAFTGVERLAAARLDIIKKLMASEVLELRRIGLRSIAKLGTEDAIPLLEEALLDPEEGNRVGAVAQLRDRLGVGHLPEILQRYTTLETYFYNVVVWLDRLAYAPAPVSSFYEAELSSRVATLSK